jgi:hypothetical protein
VCEREELVFIIVGAKARFSSPRFSSASASE